jgi:hypothetical protein
LSIVSVPANPEALITERSFRSAAAHRVDPELGEAIGQLYRAVTIKHLRNALPAPRYTLEDRRAIARKLRSEVL